MFSWWNGILDWKGTFYSQSVKVNRKFEESLVMIIVLENMTNKNSCIAAVFSSVRVITEDPEAVV